MRLGTWSRLEMFCIVSQVSYRAIYLYWPLVILRRNPPLISLNPMVIEMLLAAIWNDYLTLELFPGVQPGLLPMLRTALGCRPGVVGPLVPPSTGGVSVRPCCLVGGLKL